MGGQDAWGKMMFVALGKRMQSGDKSHLLEMH